MPLDGAAARAPSAGVGALSVPGDSGAPVVEYDEEARRFEVHVVGSPDVAFLEVVPGGKFWTFTHTQVPASFRGQGIGSVLVRGALQHVRDLGAKVKPVCPFVIEFLKQHPEETAVVHPRWRHLVE